MHVRLDAVSDRHGTTVLYAAWHHFFIIIIIKDLYKADPGVQLENSHAHSAMRQLILDSCGSRIFWADKHAHAISFIQSLISGGP